VQRRARSPIYGSIEVYQSERKSGSPLLREQAMESLQHKPSSNEGAEERKIILLREQELIDYEMVFHKVCEKAEQLRDTEQSTTQTVQNQSRTRVQIGRQEVGLPLQCSHEAINACA